MARNPAERYQTALEMKHDLDHPDQVQVTGPSRPARSAQGLEGQWRGAQTCRPRRRESHWLSLGFICVHAGMYS